MTFIDDVYQRSQSLEEGQGGTMVPNHSIRISADRGGTFCDVYACVESSVSAFHRLVTYFRPISSRDYPDPDNPRLRKGIVVKLCASLLTAL